MISVWLIATITFVVMAQDTLFVITYAVYAFWLMGFVITLQIFRLFVLQRAISAMTPDKLKYEGVWSAVLSEQRSDLNALAVVARSASKRKRDQSIPVLNVLLWQADEINEWYQGVVASWAQYLRVKHHVAPVKSEKRATEKLLRSYAGRAERVLDFVRSTLIVNSINEATLVLKFVLDEVDVTVVKNRFDPAYDGKETFGYRDINMQLSFPEFRDTPWHGYILELQIHLKDILAIKSDEGHKKYIQVRNLSGM